MMTSSENRGETQPGRMQLQTGPGRDAIAKSVRLSTSPGRTYYGESCTFTLQDVSAAVNAFPSSTESLSSLNGVLFAIYVSLMVG